MRQYSQMRGTPRISGCPCHYKRPVLPPQKKKQGVWQWQWDVVGFIVWFHTPALPQRNWQNNPVLLHGATRGYGRYHVNVGSEPLVGFRVWSEYSSVYVWIYCICACMVCVWVCVVWVQSLMWNARESPNHPVFHLVLLLPHSFLSSVSFSSFALSAIWPRWTDLWQKCSDSSVIMVWVALMGLILFHQILLQKLHRQLRQ